MTLHVGLNLVFLVPGETGGMETYTRELMQALRVERPDLRLTAFLGRDAYEPSGPWREVASVLVPVRARRRAEWVRGEQFLLPRLAERRGSTCSTASRARHRRGGASDVSSRFTTSSTRGTQERTSASGRSGCACSSRSRRGAPIGSSCRPRAPAATSSRCSGSKPRASPSCPRASSVPDNVPAVAEDELRRRFALGGRAILLTAAAKRPHKNLVRLLDALALVPPARRARSRSPRLPDAARGRAPCACGRDRRRC